MAPWMQYLTAVTPALLLVAVLVMLLPRRSHGLRIMTLILGFILARDSMTRHGLWEFGTEQRSGGPGVLAELPVLWVRFTDDPVALLVMAVASLALAGGVLLACRDRIRSVMWTGANWFVSVVLGLVGAVVVVAPLVVLYGPVGEWFSPVNDALRGLTGAGIPVADRGGTVALSLLPALLLFALCGNLVEEVLFRGFLQRQVEDELSGRGARWRAVFVSSLAFGCAHLFLAFTVTGLGWPIVLFTLWEGLVCAVIALRHGVLGATVTHGVAIFVLASGLI
ncbi:CPBP family intramembrane glutamic endopeptidase [Micrococcus terreus]|uniref:CPBP family intramembrane glutamic endopeptidase n=1 Tax=Micrococcus terreus TaxID=574650 RepID=UPI0023F8BE9F|nr:CPBP family intramembrane glutamic endopeptidase [Micrococcus terreus]